MKITMAIVDDEIHIRKKIVNMLSRVSEKLAYTVEIFEFSSGTEFLKNKKRYDMIFLDIKMPEINGFKTAEKYRVYGKEDIIIFLTNYDDLCKEGYKVNAFRFLGKQDNICEMQEAVVSAFKIINSRERLSFFLDTGQEIYLGINEIYYIEASGRSILINTPNKVYKVKEKISEMSILLDGKGFYLVHRAYLVNMQYVVTCNKREIEMINGDKIIVSEKRYGEFKKHLLIHKFERGYK